MKTQLFPRQAKPKILFVLHCNYTSDNQYRVWFDLDNSLTRWKKIFFKICEKSHFEKFSKFSMQTHFFLGKLYQQLSCLTLTLHWWYSIPSLVWFEQLRNPMKKTFFLKFFFHEIQNVPYENPTFFPGKLYQKFFAKHSHYAGDTPYHVWFDLDNFLTRWNRTKFKIPFSRNSKSSVWKPNFFLDKLNQKYFLIYTVITLVIINTEFGLIWTTPWPDKKEFF